MKKQTRSKKLPESFEKFSIGIIFACSTLNGVSAQEGNPVDPSTAACPAELEAPAATVRQLFDQAETKFKTVDEFLAVLPKEITSNFIFMGESRSFQSGTRANPRVIMTSPNSDVRLSFSTDPGGRGYNNIEFSFWDPIKRKYEYKELTFSGNGSKPPKRHGDVACTTCHGNPPKPNWDTYNFWSGAIPFNKDTIVKGTKESEWYLGYLDRINNKVPGNRMQYLTPLESRGDIESSLSSGGYLTRRYLDNNGNKQLGNGGGVGVQFFDNVVARQRCAEAKNLSEKDIFPKVKYLLAGLAAGCSSSDLDKFVPEWYPSVAKNFFYSSMKNFDLNKVDNAELRNTVYKQVEDDTNRRQLYQKRDKEGRQKVFFERELGSLEKAEAEMKTNIDAIGLNAVGTSPGENKANIGETASGVAQMRYYLQPFGVDVSRFSSSIDPSTYSFADLFSASFLDQAESQKINKQIESDPKLNEMDRCKALAKLSMDAIGGDQAFRDKIIDASQGMCRQRLKDQNLEVKFINELDKQAIKFNAAEAFKKRCASCHSDQTAVGIDYSVGGAPVFPFKQIVKLEEKIKSVDGRLIGLASKMRERINRPHQYPGAMPLEEIVKMTDEEKAFMNLWLNQFLNDDQLSMER